MAIKKTISILKMHLRSQSPRLSAGLDRENIKFSFHLDDSPAFRQGRVNAIGPIEKNIKSVKWTGMIPDGCYCKDKIGTDGKLFNKHFFVCSVGAGSGLEITYSHDLSINRIQYFEP